MRQKAITPEMIALIPRLAEWGDTEISIADWVGEVGNFELAIGYSRVFWPRFVEFRGYVLVEEAADEDLVAMWEATTGGDKRAVEAVLNHIHMIDINGGNPTASHNESQLIELGRTLRDIYSAKLAWQFPDRKFEVVFDDSAGLSAEEYEVTFWTVRNV